MSGLDEQYRGFLACPKCEKEYYWIVYKATMKNIKGICLNSEKYFKKHPNSMKINTGGMGLGQDDVDSIELLSCGWCGHKPNSMLVDKVKIFARILVKEGIYIK